MKKKNKRWSYSRWSMYRKCPAQYEWHYLLGHKRGSSYALERGVAIHKKAENYVNGKINGLPKELKKYTKEFKALRLIFKKKSGHTEPDISMNKNRTVATRKTTDYFVGFADFAHLGYDLTVIDYKTGRKYPEHREQGCIYALVLLCLYPEYDTATVEFWYLDSGELTEFTYYRKDLERLLAVWDRRINKMYNDKVFKKTPYKYCKSCNRNKLNGGDCDAR